MPHLRKQAKRRAYLDFFFAACAV
nr:hypothetical protein P5648_05850 [Bacillus subtilis]